MRIVHAPFINHVVVLTTVESPNMQGDVLIHGLVGGKKNASLTLELAEALRIYRELKKMDIEAVAKAYGVG